MGVAVRSGAAGLAHRVLGDEHEVPRRALRHPHRRRGQHLSAPRERDRAERGRRRAIPSWTSGCTPSTSSWTARRCRSRRATSSRSPTCSRSANDPAAVRYLFLSVPYRKKLNFTWDGLAGAAAAVDARAHGGGAARRDRGVRKDRRGGFPAAERAARLRRGVHRGARRRPEHRRARRARSSPSCARSTRRSTAARSTRPARLEARGRDRRRPTGSSASCRSRPRRCREEIEAQIAARNDARKRRDFAEADRIRKELAGRGHRPRGRRRRERGGRGREPRSPRRLGVSACRGEAPRDRRLPAPRVEDLAPKPSARPSELGCRRAVAKGGRARHRASSRAIRDSTVPRRESVKALHGVGRGRLAQRAALRPGRLDRRRSRRVCGTFSRAGKRVLWPVVAALEKGVPEWSPPIATPEGLAPRALALIRLDRAPARRGALRGASRADANESARFLEASWSICESFARGPQLIDDLLAIAVMKMQVGDAPEAARAAGVVARSPLATTIPGARTLDTFEREPRRALREIQSSPSTAASIRSRT